MHLTVDAMKRGTLMFLKRLLVTALGALGLGGLAAGTALGQTAGEGNVPAPNIFDDQIVCSMLVPPAMGPSATPRPSVVPQGGETSPLDDAIGMGTVQLLDANNSATNNISTFLVNAGYVIPAGNNNCGAGATGPTFGTMGMDANNDGDFLDAGDVLEATQIPIDVADGYTDLLSKFVAIYGDPGGTTGGTARELEAAKKAQRELSADATSAQRTAAQNRVDTAQAAHNKALAAYNQISAGLGATAVGQSPIYKAGVAEWMAKATVTQSIADYNKEVEATYGADGTGGAKGQLDAMTYADAAAASLWVPLGNNELYDSASTTTVVSIAADGMATVNHDQLIQYTNADLGTPQIGTPGMAGMGTGDGSAGNDAPVGSNTSASNFDAAGNLIIPMEPNTATGDDGTDLRRVTSSANGVSAIRTIVENANIAAAALKKARDENVGLNQDIYDEAYRRAQLEADYYNQRWAEVLAHNVDTRTDDQKDPDNAAYVASPITIASRHSDYLTASNKRSSAEQNLRAAVKAREMATANVRDQFNDPQSFYQQLVDRRKALKAAADKAVTDAQANGGTASKILTDAATDAGKALTAAEAAQTNLKGLFADENDPTVDLIKELTMTGGDDGQAVVNAISSNYNAINDLTAEDDPSTLEDETGRIVKLEEQVGMLTGDGSGGGLGALQDQVNALTAGADTMDDASDDGLVTTNTNRSTKNAENIGKLDGRVADNEADLDTVWEDYFGMPRDVDMQHDSLADHDCSVANTSTRSAAFCGDARSLHNEEELDMLMGADGPIQANADAIDALTHDTDDGDAMDGPITANRKAAAMAQETANGAMTAAGKAQETANEAKGTADANKAEIGFDMETGMSRIDMNEMTANDAKATADANEMEIGMDDNGMSRIDHNEAAIFDAEGNSRIAANAMAASDAAGAASMAQSRADAAHGLATTNGSLISGLDSRLGTAEGNIRNNTAMIGGLQDQMEIVRAGVAASMALAGMPAINGRGIAIGVGSYDGESAFAVGFQIQGEQASFKVGVTSSGGETGASAGVGFNF